MYSFFRTPAGIFIIMQKTRDNFIQSRIYNMLLYQTRTQNKAYRNDIFFLVVSDRPNRAELGQC